MLSTPVPIGSVSFADSATESFEADTYAPQTVTAEQTRLIAELDAQKKQAEQTFELLTQAAEQLGQTCQSLIRDHQDQIAQLAVEIARTVLMRQIEEGAYDIQTIVKEALSHSPTLEDVTVRVNPQDLAQCRALMSDKKHNETMLGIQFTADPQIGRAECVVESPKGIIQSLIDEHLKQISEALSKSR